MDRFRVHALALACLFALPVSTFASAPVALPKGVQAHSCVEGICEYQLPNGLRVLLFPDNSKPTVTVNLTYLVGSVHENYGETGMAHLLEHLQFKGTPKNPDITAELKKRGVGYNATTSVDRTNYFSSFPANDATLDYVLQLEADRMVNSFIAKKDLDSEMTVVRNELERNENNPGSVLNQRLRATAYQWHNYGKPTIGLRSDIENVPIAHLQAFYRTWYQPDNAVLVMAGNFDSATALRKIANAFAPLKKPSRTLPVSWTVEPVQDGEREINVRRSGDIRITGLAYHVPAATHPDTPALMVLSNLLAHTPGGRLHKALVESKLAVASAAGSGASHDPGLFNLVVAVAKDGDLSKAEAELLKQAETIPSQPITEAELADAKQRIANAFELAFNDVNAVGMALSESIAAGDWRLRFVLRDAIAKVTLDDVNRVAKTYLISSNRTLARFIPTDAAVRANIGAAPSAASMVNGYTGNAAVESGEAFDPTPANIAARSEIYRIGDGLTVSLLPKKNRGGTVTFSATFRFADVNAMRKLPLVAQPFVGSLPMRGSQTLSREQIDKRFQDLKTSVGISGSGNSASIVLQSRHAELLPALTLAADVLRHPAFPESEFEQMRAQALAGVEAARKEPGTVISQAMGKTFDPWPADHPYHFRSLDQIVDDLKALKLDDIRNYFRAVYGTSEGQIAIVGDFDPAQIKPALEQLFAAWKPGVAYAPVATHYTAAPAVNQRFETPDKANAVYSARMNLPLNDEDPDYEALQVANNIFGGGALKSRLGDRVRQKDGLSYGIGSSISADASRDNKDDAGSFTIQASAAPQNIDKLIAAVREELVRFVAEGITESELRDAVNGILVARTQSRANDGSIAGMLNSDAYLDRNMQMRAVSDAKYKALTVAEVNAAIRKFIKPDQLSVFVAGDFSNADKNAAASK